MLMSESSGQAKREQLLLKKSYRNFLNAALRKRIPFLSGVRISQSVNLVCIYLEYGVDEPHGNKIAVGYFSLLFILFSAVFTTINAKLYPFN